MVSFPPLSPATQCQDCSQHAELDAAHHSFLETSFGLTGRTQALALHYASLSSTPVRGFNCPLTHENQTHRHAG